MSNQCGRDVEGKEDKEAISNLAYIEVEGQDKKKRKISYSVIQFIENSLSHKSDACCSGAI